MKLIFFLVCLSMLSCFPKFEPNKQEDRLYLKELDFNDKQVQWFYYSSAVSESPDYIVIRNRDNKEDTIVLSTNIADINIEKDSIKISFYGKPKKYDEKINANTKGYHIKIDTTAVSSGPTYRKFYKKSK